MTPSIITVNRGVRCVARSLEVARPAADIYAILQNPHRHHELDGSATVGSVVVGPEILSRGDQFRVAMSLGFVKYRMTNTVTEAIPGRVLEWSLPAGHRWRWELVDIGGGMTRVTECFDYRAARLPWLMELLGFPARNALGIESTLRRLSSVAPR